ncbi:MAG TPA: diacylglycerol kinase family protein [Nordella sp.]|nr:diacylglycerol kinase family protein [Nordella sp.]
MVRGLIVNPQSGKSSGKGLKLASLLQAHPHVIVRVLENFSQLNPFIAEMAAAGVTDLFVSSGDGTVQAIQTEIAERLAPTFFPRLTLLPHGTTNMTAADLGFRNHNVNVQADFIANREPRVIVKRPTLRVANPKDGRIRHGMFLGTGAIWQATVFCQDVVHGTGLKGDFATFATLAAAVAKALFTRADPHDKTRIDRPYPIGLSRDGATIVDGEHLLLLATTLDKLILGTKPFWGGKSGPVRISTVPYPVPSILRWLLPLMYGGEGRSAPQGAHSFSGHVFEIATKTPFVIDGEFFEGPDEGPLRLETGPEFTYVCG